ncbi:3-hydroxyacyl-CoA dehydrogenase family protein [Mycetocola spongiae]|uniref:3-hydroxyacyl-CoA dehydrogenase family protein n=1 Tax=Mycetocola spongiae TaxID=2859226 RepID=UPI001CF2ABC7|nr:3-hydroxyacyl-CoA dehydrogenase family protein [Mycetocola spongiae]UCR90054.1 3-hydroxyacyl-CoA dehydrogenase family protein [Mycetocola spongiae]
MTFNLPQDIHNRPVTVIGAGTLGRRIAMMFATRGGLVRLYDLSAEQREQALTYIRDTLPAVVDTIEGGRVGTVDGAADLTEAVANAWLVVEAIPERLDLKTQIFGELDRITAPDTILASNSSSYASAEFISEVSTPERVLNAHFYMPPQQNALDLMSSGHTDRGILDLLLAELPGYGLFPFEARAQSTGFIFNRVWAAVKREALAVVAEGVTTPREFDAMMKVNTHSPVGIFELMDQVGLDVVLDIEEHYAAENPHLPEGPRRILREYVEAGNLGKKTGQGFYDYAEAPA